MGELKKHDTNWEEVRSYIKNYFDMADADKDGVLTSEEGRAFQAWNNLPYINVDDIKKEIEEGDLEEYSRRNFEYCDFNKDGFLSKHEVASCMLKHKFSYRKIDTILKEMEEYGDAPEGLTFEQYAKFNRDGDAKKRMKKVEVSKIENEIEEHPDETSKMKFLMEGAQNLAVAAGTVLTMAMFT